MDALSPLDPVDPNIPSRKFSPGLQGSYKPLPPPPQNLSRTMPEAPVLNTPPNASESSPHAPRPSLSGTASYQRPKKRVIWRNKGIIIALPIDTEFGKKTSKESYLSPEDVAKRLDYWKDEGYDTKGFVLAAAPDETVLLLDGQSRAVYPDPEDEKRERAERVYNVSIPDRREWEAYVTQLKEEKLRALGVSFGNEELPRKSPAPSLMSRQASSQSSAMLISPALAPSVHSIPFPSNFQSAVSPATQVGKPGVSHFPRYSMAMPFGEKSFSPPNQIPQPSQSPVAGTWSPQQSLGSQPNSRVASPLTNGGQMQGLDRALSPPPGSLPMVQSNMAPVSSLQASFMHQQQALQQMQQQQQQEQRQMQQMQQQQMLAQQQILQPQLQPLTGNLQSKGRQLQAPPLASQPYIASPIPHGHRQNPSETLQKELDGNGSYLNRSTTQEEGQQDVLSNGKENAIDDTPVPAKAMEKSSKVQTSDLDTNPSLAGTPEKFKSGTGPPQNEHISQFSSSPKLSSSKLNVNAPEFKFDPKKTFDPELYPLLGNQQPTNAVATQAAPKASNSKHARKHSSGPTKFNVAAPVFTPGAARQPTVPSRDFSFSTSGPSYRSDALTFKPIDPGPGSATESSGKEKHVEAVKKIFGDFKFHEVIKPTKKSKAVPIVRPDDSSESPGKSASETEGQEDESGRITQADGRQKRLRRETNDGDQVPLFASQNQTLCLDDGYDDRAAKFNRRPSPTVDEATVDVATELLEELIDDLSATEASELMREDESVDTDGKPFEPHDFHDIDEAANFNAALPPRPSREKSPKTHEATPDEVVKATKGFLERVPRYRSAFDHTLEDRISGSWSPHVPEDLRGSYQTDVRHEDGIGSRDHARQDIMDGVRYVEPSYNEIDAIMKHLNQDGSDLGVERRHSPLIRRSLSASPIRPSALSLQDTSRSCHLLPSANVKSDAPSSSPNCLRGAIQHLPPTDTESADTYVRQMVARNACYSPSYRPSRTSPPVHRLNSRGSTPSDWNDAVSSIDEANFKSRTAFFDNRVNDLVGDVVQQRLSPLEKTLSNIQESLTTLSGRSASRRSLSSGKVEVVHSDADDEDETEGPRTSSRMKSPLRDRKYDQLKSSIIEITAAQQNFAPTSQLAEVMEALKDLKASVQQSQPLLAPAQSDDIKSIIEEVLGRQGRGKSGPVRESTQAAIIEKNQLQIAGLESMLKAAETRADDEMKARRSTEDALADNQRLLRQALQEGAQQREAAEATERSLQEYHGERQNMIQRTAMLEGSQESLEKNISDLSDKNAALEGTLAEYRLSSDQWRSEIDDARYENKNLRRTIDSLKAELEDNVQGRQALGSKFDRLQEDMTRASQEMVLDQTKWRSKEQEHNTRLDMLSACLEAEARTRERLELEIERLETQEKEAMKARFMVEQTQKANAQLEALVTKLRSESHEYQKTAARFEREFRDAKEATGMEVQRTRIVLERDAEAANNQVNIVRAGLESVVARLHEQIDSVTADANDAKARHELMLEEASESRNTALQEAADAREAALQEHYRFHERAIRELKAQHECEVSSILEDKQRSETCFGNRLSLADEKVTYYQDKIARLEENLEIAKSAAHAAVLAAQKKSMASPSSTRPQPFPSSIPEKISPQALRESIMVLQEQLQERESRIERLESKLSAVDVDAPAKLKDANIEITWLRELLGVRIDDLEDIISTLSQPAYNREAVKDAAIRLKANLQMEQQEKERALTGGQTFPTLTSISKLAASPKALPLAAAAAWGNWRKAREQGQGFGNLNAMANENAHQHQTPWKPSPQSFFVGLMTPPSTNLRATPLPASNGNRRPLSSSSRQRDVRDPATPRQSMNDALTNELLGHKQEPVTPPLMRKSSYDLDASENGGFGDFGDEGVEGNRMAGDDEPFGPKLGGIVRG